MMDVLVFKIIGLYQVLWPSGGGNLVVGHWCRTVWIALQFVSLALLIVQLAGLYFYSNDFQRFAFQSMVMGNTVMCLSKSYVMLRNADRLRGGLDVAAYAFTARGRQDPSEVRRCRARLSAMLRVYVVVCYVTLAVWMATPVIAHKRVTLARLDGTVTAQRPNFYNYWFPVPDSAYDTLLGWTVVYAIEASMGTVNVVTWLWFDCYAVTMCYALRAQFRTVTAGYEALGNGRPGIHTEKDDMKLDFHGDLITGIRDNQKIIEKFNDFYDIFKPVVFVQITAGSYGVIMIIFLLAYLMGVQVESIALLKLFSGFLSVVFELFIFCYIFNYADTAKSMVNFGLYSSNWTSMDLKFKKTLLLAMNMNSSHSRMMKITPITIIDLEMFSRVMKMSYSTVSLLLNKSNT